MTIAIAEGSRVRVTRASVCADPDMNGSAGIPSHEYDVCYFVPAGAKGNDDPDGKAYYLLDEAGSYGGSHWAYPEDLEITMTAEQKRARKPPPLQNIRNGVASAVMSMYSPVDAYEADYEGEGSFLVTGRTHDGLTIGFRVTVSEVENLEDWA